MSSEHLASAQNELKGNLGGAWNILDGAQGQYQDLGVARRFGGSAAAYSLRDIGAMNGRVVKARRDVGETSDPEEDFSASQVQSGALKDWVNGKLESTLPADVATAAAAYSLRKVDSSYSGNSVRIRRSSDDIEVDVAFDSDDKVSASSVITNIAEQGGEIGSTTATDLNGFLNETLTVGTAVNGTSPYGNYDFEANSNTGFDADNSAGGTGSAGFPYSFASGDVMIIRYTVSNFDSTSSLSPAVRGTTGTNSVVAAAGGGTTFTANGTYTDTLTATADGTHLMFADGNTGSYTISDFQIVSHTHQAFVHTWYDQAGTNNAVQETATNQPKIAESGALLDGIKFSSASDGTSANHLDIAAKLMDSTDGFMSSVINSVQDMNQLGVIYGNRNNNSGFVFGIHQAEYPQVFYRQSSGANRLENSNFTLSSSSKYLLSVDKDGTNDANLFGNAVSRDTDSSMNYITSTGSASKIGQGGNTVTSDANGLNANINELIFYNSDQAANRFKIESNINNYYGLYNDANDLAGNFTVDSSGSGTDASISNESKTGFTATVVDKAGFFGADLNEAVPNGSNLYISFTANLSPSGGTAATPNFGLANSADKTGNSTGNPLDTAVAEGFNSITVAGTSSTCDRIRFTEGNDNVSFIISDLKVSRIARNGFVETWYDQSANLRDAIQGTATNQPSIVQNGGIVKVNSKPAITFDGSDNFLEVDGSGSAVAYSFSPSGDMGMFIVYKASVGNIIDSRDAGSDGIFLQQSSSTDTRFRYNGDGSINIVATNDEQHFNTMTLDGTTLSASVDGGTAGTDTVTAGVSTTSNLVLGKAFSGNNSNFVDGEIQEAIFYENNKTSEKSDIETDIDNFYSIT